MTFFFSIVCRRFSTVTVYYITSVWPDMEEGWTFFFSIGVGDFQHDYGLVLVHRSANGLRSM